MPALKITVGGDAMPFIQEMKRMEAAAAASGQSVLRSLSSTVANANAPKPSASNAYVDWWKKNIDNSSNAIKEYYARKAAGGVNVYSPSGFGNFMQREAAASMKSTAIKEYYARKQASGGVNVYGPSGFGEFMKREAQVGMKALPDAVGNGIVLRAVENGRRAGKGMIGGFMAAIQGSTSASSQLISVVSNTLSSLGAGMSPGKILMQQGPNFAQAFTLMGTSARGLLSTLVPLASAFVGLPASVFLLTRALGEALYPSKMLATEYDTLAARAKALRKQLLEAREDDVAELKTSSERIAHANKLLELQEKISETEDDIKKKKLEAQIIDAAKLGNTAKEFELRRQMVSIDADRNARRLAEAQTRSRNNTIGAEDREKLRAEIGEIEMQRDEFRKKVNDAEAAVNRAKPLSYEKKKALEEYSRIKTDEFREEELFSNNIAALQQKIADSSEVGSILASEQVAQAKLAIQENQNSISEINKNESDFYSRQIKPQPLTSREQIGAYAGGGPAVSLLDVNRKQLTELNKNGVKLDAILAELKAL